MEYGNTIANLGCSILKYFGADTINPTLKAADALLEKPYKNVVVLLLDGLGVTYPFSFHFAFTFHIF